MSFIVDIQSTKPVNSPLPLTAWRDTVIPTPLRLSAIEHEAWSMMESPMSATRCTPNAANGTRPFDFTTVGQFIPGFVDPASRHHRSHITTPDPATIANT